MAADWAAIAAALFPFLLLVWGIARRIWGVGMAPVNTELDRDEAPV